MNKPKKSKTSLRVCCITKQVFTKSQLVRITKSNHQIFINDTNCQGRSVYFLYEEAKKLNTNKFYNLIKAKLKFDLQNSDKNLLKEFLNQNN